MVFLSVTDWGWFVSLFYLILENTHLGKWLDDLLPKGKIIYLHIGAEFKNFTDACL